MTIIGKSLIAAVGLLTLGLMTPASAGSLTLAKPAFNADNTAGVQLVSDRGSWSKAKKRFKSSRFDNHRRGNDHHHYVKKKKKSKKFAKRGFRKGYSRGYDKGYYEGRRHSRIDRRHRHFSRNSGFRGGIRFGNGYFSNGGFRFRY